jgi:hypothetical protein
VRDKNKGAEEAAFCGCVLGALLAVGMAYYLRLGNRRRPRADITKPVANITSVAGSGIGGGGSPGPLAASCENGAKWSTSSSVLQTRVRFGPVH